MPVVWDDSSSSSDESCDDITTDDVEPDSRLRLVTEELRDMLCHNECGYNWFDNLPSQTQEKFSSLPTQLVLDTFTKCGFSENDVGLLSQSYLAFSAVDMYIV